ncbi:type I-F CRISPR-associated endoribonuclease Cas6/Csy4 [Sansalvadorimonas verongulae]|uniref:type I-F CRISPR-associated endoribonuclease Cas6/Csy4 n=1 Tax=Sansalvadorimonas verongulae TaxID=2172824 RepID=UPI0012BCED10|nr:type I-F CRISPR-associated endoribonuclease Cas6/Csy4 [Sansalvadorimonas verongulae]MTI11874.1 type I-F CRISPR-associated endoribonuclease Cas6/Csy4 [Sansalvadorimonas verongulae]
MKDTQMRYYFEISHPDSPDENKSFHESVFKAIHDQAEPYDDPLTAARYRSWVGLSYPLFGDLDRYIMDEELLTDSTFRLNFAIQHPGLYVGNVVHCVASQQEPLKQLMSSEDIRTLQATGVVVSTITPVPAGVTERIYKRDRRPERRSWKCILRKTKNYNLNSTDSPYVPKPITEPLPRFANMSSNNKRKPIHLKCVEADKPHDSWYSMYGLSTKGSTVPRIPVQ